MQILDNVALFCLSNNSFKYDFQTNTIYYMHVNPDLALLVFMGEIIVIRIGDFGSKFHFDPLSFINFTLIYQI